MKIWKATLTLGLNSYGKWETIFKFDKEPENRDYRVHSINNDEWVAVVNWDVFLMPKNKTIYNWCYSTTYAIQGFDYELNRDELRVLEKDMEIFMFTKLIEKYEGCVELYDGKMQFIKESILV